MLVSNFGFPNKVNMKCRAIYSKIWR